MKLTTDIKPRKDKTVRVSVPAIGQDPAAEYVFKCIDGEPPTCDVAIESHAHYLMDTGNFVAEGDASVDHGDEEEGEEEGGESTGSNSPPIEANTPPKPKAEKPKDPREPKAKKSAAKAAGE